MTLAVPGLFVYAVFGCYGSAGAFILQSAVKAFDVGVVVGSV